MSIYKFGWKPELKDGRDFRYYNHNEFKMCAVEHLPEQASVLEGMPGVKDQGQIGSCVWNALAAAFEFIQLKELKKAQVDLELPEEFGKSYTPVSRLFGYYNSRAYDHDIPMDNGTQIRTGIKVARNIGIVEEALWPYEPKNLFVQPIQEAFIEAKKHRVLTGYRLDHTKLEQLKACIANGYPFVFGIPVTESIMHLGPNHIVEMPGPNDSIIGGHAVTAFEYNDSTKLFTIRNSWGIDFGKLGNFYLPYQYLNELAADCWTVRSE